MYISISLPQESNGSPKVKAKLLTLYLHKQLLLHEHIRQAYPDKDSHIRKKTTNKHIQKKKRQGAEVIRKNLDFSDIKKVQVRVSDRLAYDTSQNRLTFFMAQSNFLFI